MSLNLLQERELNRLIEYERSMCESRQDSSYRCAFPNRPDNDLQCELIEAGMLSRRDDSRHGKIVVITSAGYSYFAQKTRDLQREELNRKRDVRLIGFTAIFCALCMIVGFLLGMLAR